MSIPNVTDSRYLGITISVKKCDLDLKCQKRNFYSNTNMLFRKFVQCSPDAKYYLLKHIFVTCTVHHSWYDSTKTAIKYLKVAYNNSLRRLLGLPSYNRASGMFVNLTILSFAEVLGKYVYNFRNILETSDKLLFVVVICFIFHCSLAYGIGGVTSCHHNYSIIFI